MQSLLLPSFISKLANPQIKTVLLCGCGGGFDFIHSLILYPELLRMGKKLIIGSYSYGDTWMYYSAKVVFNKAGAEARIVDATTTGDQYYSPEVHACAFLDEKYPQEAPHSIYAYYARAFTVPLLKQFYQQLIKQHAIDAIVVVDGGSDSLMVGDESGLGDPIEDTVSITAIAELPDLIEKIHLVVGLGADRYNGVSNASTLKAIAELTQTGGFLGSISLEPTAPCSVFYTSMVNHIFSSQGFRSVLAGTIKSAIQGWFGFDCVPPDMATRVKPGELFFSPLMAMLWAFNVDHVAQRSLISKWIKNCETVQECHDAFNIQRVMLGNKRRSLEFVP
jgi:hypothetical protein